MGDGGVTHSMCAAKKEEEFLILLASIGRRGRDRRRMRRYENANDLIIRCAFELSEHDSSKKQKQTGENNRVILYIKG
jgi:hypothetical protein